MKKISNEHSGSVDSKSTLNGTTLSQGNQHSKYRTGCIRRILIWSICILTSSLGALVLLLQSEWFYRDYAFPFISRSIGGTLKVEYVKIRLLHTIELKNITFEDPLGNKNSVEELTLKYKLYRLLFGEVSIYEATLKNCSLNLDSFLKIAQTSSKGENSPLIQELRKEDEPLYSPMLFTTDLKKVTLENISLSVSGTQFGQKLPNVIKLQDLAIDIQDFQSNQGGASTVKFTFESKEIQGKDPFYAEGKISSYLELHENRKTIGATINISLNNIKGDAFGLQLDNNSINLDTHVEASRNGINFDDFKFNVYQSDSLLLSLLGDAEYTFDNYPTTLKVKLKELHNDLLNLFPNIDTSIEDALFSGNLTLFLWPTRDFKSEAYFNVDRLKFRNTSISPTDLKGSEIVLSTSGSNNKVQINNLAIKLIDEGKTIADIIMSGNVNKKDIAVKTKINELHNEFLKIIPEITPPTENGLLEGEFNASYNSNEELNIEGKLGLKDLAFVGIAASDKNPSSANLTFKASRINQAYLLDSLNLSISSKETMLADTSFAGSLSSSESGYILNGISNTKSLDLDPFVALLPETKNPSEEKKEEQSETSDNTSGLSLNIESKIDHATYESIIVKDASANLKFEKGVLSADNLRLLLNDAPLKGAITLNPQSPLKNLSLNLDIQSLELSPVIKLFNAKMGEDISGQLKHLSAVYKTLPASDGSSSPIVSGDFKAVFKDLKVPAYLQDTPPVNLIFLPIDVLNQTVGRLGNIILPSSITDLTKSMNKEMKEVGRIVFNDARIHGVIDNAGINFTETKFDSSILPNITFNGRIGFNEKVNLVIGIEILKISVPLPVGGTLSIPLPDIVGFVPAIIRSLGLSITNVRDIFVGQEQKDKEFFNDTPQDH